VARPRSTAPPRLTVAPRPAPAAVGAEPARAGFVLYVGLQGDSPDLDAQHAADLAEVAEALRDLARDLLPTAETFTALSLVPGTGGSDDVQSLRSRLAGLRPLGADADGVGADDPVADSA
jgi:hypothetical protein